MVKQGITKAVGYIRMSTDQQTESPARQRAEIEKLAEEQGLKVIHWYEDHGETGTESANRPEFLQLLTDAKKRQFAAVLIYEQSRLSREDVFDAMMHWRILKDAGVRIITCQRGEIRFDNLGDLITAVVGQHGAHDESIKISQRSSTGKRQQVMAGWWLNGGLFGFDREFVSSESGSVISRVSFRDAFQKPKGWKARLVPSADVAAVDGVRFAFDAIAEQRMPVGRIAAELNRRGVLTRRGREWSTKTVGDLLRNPAYAGTLRSGKYARGKFSTILEDGEILEKHNAFPGLISREKFEQAQEVLHSKSLVRSPTAEYMLSGVVFCGHCGGRMTGRVGPSRNSDSRIRRYGCNRRKDGSNSDCPLPFVNAERIEAFVLQVACEYVLCDDNVERLREVAIMSVNENEPPSVEHQQLAEVQTKIERATENLALADSDDFKSISSVLAKWREDERELQKRIKASRKDVQPNSDILKAIANLGKVRQHLHLASADTLGPAIRSMVHRIEINRTNYPSGYHEFAGRLEFSADALPGESLPIAHAEIAADHLYRQVHRYLSKRKKPVAYKRLYESLGFTDGQLWQTLKRAEHLHLVSRSKSGWQAIAIPGSAK